MLYWSSLFGCPFIIRRATDLKTLSNFRFPFLPAICLNFGFLFIFKQLFGIFLKPIFMASSMLIFLDPLIFLRFGMPCILRKLFLFIRFGANSVQNSSSLNLHSNSILNGFPMLQSVPSSFL